MLHRDQDSRIPTQTLLAQRDPFLLSCLTEGRVTYPRCQLLKVLHGKWPHQQGCTVTEQGSSAHMTCWPSLCPPHWVTSPASLSRHPSTFQAPRPLPMFPAFWPELPCSLPKCTPLTHSLWCYANPGCALGQWRGHQR